MESAKKPQAAEELVRRFAAAVRSAQLYAAGHPLVQRSLDSLHDSVQQFVSHEPSIAIGFLEQEIVVGDVPLHKAGDGYADFIRRIQAVGIERIAFERGVTPDALNTLVLTLAHPERRAGEQSAGILPADAAATLQSLPKIRVGRINLDEDVKRPGTDVATIRRLYDDAVTVATSLWDVAQQEGEADAQAANKLVDDLAQAVAQNRTA